MYVAVGRVELHIPAAESLKDKRGVLQSAMTRVRNKFRVAIAEVEATDQHGLAVLGIAAISNQASHAQQQVEAVVRFLEGARLDAEVGAVEYDLFPAL